MKPVFSQAEEGQEFYKEVFSVLSAGDFRFLVGGAYALARYAGIERDTKDLDIFCRREDARRILAALQRAGCRTEITFEHWLGKAQKGDRFVDVIYGSGNGACEVGDAWFRHSTDAEIYGFPVKLVPAEEMVWQKAFIMERERFDGADVQHVFRAHGHRLDWRRLIGLFGENWRVLFAHMALFGYVYPGDRGVPESYLRELAARLVCEGPSADDRLCRGTFLSRKEYIQDVERWGYVDARLAPPGVMSREDVREWTEAAFRPE